MQHQDKCDESETPETGSNDRVGTACIFAVAVRYFLQTADEFSGRSFHDFSDNRKR